MSLLTSANTFTGFALIVTIAIAIAGFIRYTSTHETHKTTPLNAAAIVAGIVAGVTLFATGFFLLLDKHAADNATIVNGNLSAMGMSPQLTGILLIAVGGLLSFYASVKGPDYTKYHNSRTAEPVA